VDPSLREQFEEEEEEEKEESFPLFVAVPVI